MHEIMLNEDGDLEDMNINWGVMLSPQARRKEKVDAFEEDALKNFGNDLANSLKGKFTKRINLLDVMKKARNIYRENQKKNKNMVYY